MNSKIQSVSQTLDNGNPEQIATLLMKSMKNLHPDLDPEGLWAVRTRALARTILTALCDLRDRRKMRLTPQVLQDLLRLGGVLTVNPRTYHPAPGSDVFLAGAQRIRVKGVVKDAPEGEAREHILHGLVGLYLVGVSGALSEAATRTLNQFLATVPGFSPELAMTGMAQPEVTSQQVGYMTIELSRSLEALTEEVSS